MGWAGSQSPQKKEKNMLNSPAFESRECLPRMGLPRSSFIIPQCSQPRSDPIWVIINCSQHSPACSSLAHRPSKLTALRSLFLLIMLFWKEERKESNFQRRCGGFLLTLPPGILREKELHTHHGASPEMSCGFNSVSPE